MPYVTRRDSICYAFAAISPALALLASHVLGPAYLSSGSLFLLFLVPVVFSSWWGGRGPGLLSTAISATAMNYLTGSDDPLTGTLFQNNVAIFLFVVAGVLISLLGATLHQSELRNVAIMRSAIDGVVTLDLEGHIIEFNSAAEQIFGYSRSQVLGRNLAQLIVPPGATEARTDLLRYLHSGPGRMLGKRIEMTAVHADGNLFPIELSLARLPQEGPPLMAGFVRDIRPRKKLEQQLKRQIQVARLLQQASTLSSTTRSFENVLQNCLDMVCEITGWPVGHIFLPSDDQKELVASRIWHLNDEGPYSEMRHVMQSRRLKRGEALPGRIWESGEPEWVANVNHDDTFSRHAKLWSELGIKGAFGLPVKIHNEVVAVMEFFTSEDVPPDSEMLVLLGGIGEQLGQVIERRRREEQLRQAKDAAEAASRAKSEFLANVSHEVRTPMNAVLGMLQVVLSEELVPAVRDNLRTASESAKTLMSLLNDLLDFSRMEAGRFQLEAAPFNVRHGISSCVKTLSFKAHEKGLRLSCNIDPDVPDRLVGDLRRLQQVLLNLAGNAIKFTEQGEVRVDVKLLKPGDQVPNGEPAVAADAAVEIPAAVNGKESLPFGQHDQLRQRIIWREPTTPQQSDTIQHATNSTTGSKSGEPQIQPEAILHFTVTDTGIGIGPDDHARIFEPFTQVDSSSTRRHAGTGLGLTICCELIRRMGGVMWVESELGRGSRFHCTARFTVPAIQKTAAASMDPAWFNEMSTPAERSLRVLVAEDTPANQKVVTTILAKRGHRIEIARDGRETIERVEREPFDVVLMDVQMPNIDGYQATAAIRQLSDSYRATIPIIAITAHAMSGDRERCLSAGMDDYVPKPIDSSELIQTVERVAAEREPGPISLPLPIQESRMNEPRIGEGNGNGNESKESGRENPADRLEEGTMPNQQTDCDDCIIDRDAAVKRLGGDERLFYDLVRFFDEDSPGLLTEIRNGLKVQDFEQVTRSAHTLKGLAANFDAIAATTAAAKMMQIGHAQDKEQAPLALIELEREVGRLCEALAPYRRAVNEAVT